MPKHPSRLRSSEYLESGTRRLQAVDLYERRAFSRVIFWVPLTVAVGMVVLVSATSASRRLRRHLPDALDRVVAPDASATVAVLLTAAAAAFLAYWLPRRRQPRPFTIVLGVGLTAVTVALAIPSYVGCKGPDASDWNAIRWTMALFVGNVEDPFGRGSPTTCPTSMPLAVQAAALTALLTTFIGVGLAIARALGDQHDRLRARVAGAVVLVVGLDEHAEQFVGALVRRYSGSATVVVLEPDPTNKHATVVQSLGARVIVADPADPDHWLPMVSRRGLRGRRGRLRAAYLLSARVGQNVELGTLLLREYTRVVHDDAMPRLIARVDDPWQSEDWRRQQVTDDPTFLTDTVGLYRVTAQELVDHALSVSAEHLIVVGSSPLTLALLDELVQHQRERAVTLRPSQLHVTLVDSGRVLEDHRFHQRRYGNVGVARLVPSDVSIDDADEFVAECERSGRALVLLTDLPSDDQNQLANRLSIRMSTAELLVWTDDVDGIAAHSAMRRSRPYGLTLTIRRATADGHVVTSLPEDGWERIARRLHEHHTMVTTTGGRVSSSHRPWNELSDFYRNSNLRQVASALRIAVAAGRSWTPPDEASPRIVPLTDEEISRFAHLESESWRSYYEKSGWKYGGRRVERAWRLRHPALVDWERLDDDSQRLTIDGVRRSLSHLEAMGYLPFERAPDDGNETPKPFIRLGTVIAVQQSEEWTWRTEAGDVLVGKPGDWALTDEAGRRWSVIDEDFRRTYEHVAGDVWKRSGKVLARPGRAGEIVSTSEGIVTVAPGAWVIEDERSNRWVVPGAAFETSYRSERE